MYFLDCNCKIDIHTCKEILYIMLLHKRLAALHDRIVRSAYKIETRLTDKVRRADDLANVFTGRDVTTKAEVAQQNVTGGVWPRQKDVLRLQQKNTMPSIQVH